MCALPYASRAGLRRPGARPGLLGRRAAPQGPSQDGAVGGTWLRRAHPCQCQETWSGSAPDRRRRQVTRGGQRAPRGRPRRGGRAGRRRRLDSAPPPAAAHCPHRPDVGEGGFAARAAQERGARESFQLRGRGPAPLAPAPGSALGQDAGTHSLRRAPDRGGHDLLGWSGGRRGGCDHLPAGHGHSPATGRERDGEGEVSGAEKGPLLGAPL